MTQLKENLENFVGKGENAGNQHFLLFPQCFVTFQRLINRFILDIMNFLVCKCFQH